MKIRITFDLTDEHRRGIAEYYGYGGMADYSTCKRNIEAQVDAYLEGLSVVDDTPELSDLIKRLRASVRKPEPQPYYETDGLMGDAADELERLEQENSKLRAVVSYAAKLEKKIKRLEAVR